MLCLGTCLQTQHLVRAGLCPAELALSCYVMGTQVNFDKDAGEEMLPVEVAPDSRKLCPSRALWVVRSRARVSVHLGGHNRIPPTGGLTRQTFIFKSSGG